MHLELVAEVGELFFVGFGLGGLDKGVDGFDEAVGDAVVEPGKDAVVMTANCSRDGFDRFDARAFDQSMTSSGRPRDGRA